MADAPSWSPTPSGVRTVVLLFGGLLLLFHEAVIATSPRWELVVAATTMMGIEFARRRDGGK